MQTYNDFLNKVKEFEKVITSNKPLTQSKDEIVSIGKDVFVLIGKYLSNGGNITSVNLWVMLFQDISEVNKIDYPIPSNELKTWVDFSKKEYLKCKAEYEEYRDKAISYMDGFYENTLSYQNSSHRQTAVQKWQYALDKAEKMGDEEKASMIKERIHHLQAG